MTHSGDVFVAPRLVERRSRLRAHASAFKLRSPAPVSVRPTETQFCRGDVGVQRRRQVRDGENKPMLEQNQDRKKGMQRRYWKRSTLLLY